MIRQAMTSEMAGNIHARNTVTLHKTTLFFVVFNNQTFQATTFVR